MTTPQTAKTLVLHKRSLVGEMSSASAMVVLALAIVMGALFFLLTIKGMDPSQWAEALLKRLSNDPIDSLLHIIAILVVLAGVVVAYATRDANRKARLTLGPEGIEYYFPAPEWIPGITRKWFIPWGKLKDVRLQPLHYVLVLHDGNHSRTLRLLEWIEDPATEPRFGKGISLLKLPFTLKGRREMIDELPLIRALRERGIDPDAGTATSLGGTVANYDLLSSPAVRMVLIVMTALLVYILADGFLLNETWPNDPPYTVLGLLGMVGILLVILYLYLKKVPSGVSVGVGLLAGGILMFAGYSGLLRINQITDTHGLKSYEYEMISPARFHPVSDQGGLPTIELRMHELWNEQAIRSRHMFELRRGGLDFYQLNMTPIRDATRLYHEGYRDRTPAPNAK